jgi:hypothetical protein
MGFPDERADDDAPSSAFPRSFFCFFLSRARFLFLFAWFGGFTFLHFVCRFQEDVSFWERFVGGGG